MYRTIFQSSRICPQPSITNIIAEAETSPSNELRKNNLYFSWKKRSPVITKNSTPNIKPYLVEYRIPSGIDMPIRKDVIKINLKEGELVSFLKK